MTNRIYSAVLGISCVVFLANPAYSQQTNPLASDPRAAPAGGVIFRAQCATCHGADAKGIDSIDAPDLTLMWTGRELSDAEVFSTIREGVAGSIMPPHNFPDPEIWMLVSYLKSVAVSGTSRTIAGDADNGQRLFAANCARCHRVRGEGGSMGPDLTQITGRRDYPALLESIRNPSAVMVRNYRPVRLLTDNGSVVEGTLKSEDAFSIQIMGLDQQLRGYNKQQLQQIQHQQQSLMPEFASNLLSDREIDDILTFIQARP